VTVAVSVNVVGFRVFSNQMAGSFEALFPIRLVRNLKFTSVIFEGSSPYTHIPAGTYTYAFKSLHLSTGALISAQRTTLSTMVAFKAAAATLSQIQDDAIMGVSMPLPLYYLYIYHWLNEHRPDEQ